jgi:hypothetical protein
MGGTLFCSGDFTVYGTGAFIGGVMPYKSLAQERYFNANRAKLEAQGVNVDEWNKASKGKKLPKRKRKYKARGGVLGR